MLYYLFRYLGEFGVSGAHVWHYISFRAVLTLVLSLLISMWFGQYFVKWMRKHHVSEEQRDASIDPYGVDKKGVPSRMKSDVWYMLSEKQTAKVLG